MIAAGLVSEHETFVKEMKFFCKQVPFYINPKCINCKINASMGESIGIHLLPKSAGNAKLIF